jgi:hypothetical protein
VIEWSWLRRLDVMLSVPPGTPVRFCTLPNSSEGGMKYET